MSDIKALVFDAYGTLFDVRSVSRECELMFPGKGGELSALWRAKQLEYTWLRSLMGRYAGFEAITRMALIAACRVLKLGTSEDAVTRLTAAYRTLKVFPDVPGTLRLLAGKKRAILSNGSPEMLMAVVRDGGLDQHFDAVLSVDSLAIYKPHPSIYALAVKELAVGAEEVGFVSSNYWDIAGATYFGFRTFWINRDGNPPDELGTQPFAILQCFDQLPEMLA